MSGVKISKTLRAKKFLSDTVFYQKMLLALQQWTVELSKYLPNEQQKFENYIFESEVLG